MKKNLDIDTKELILESAQKEFLENGFNKATLRNIAKNAGLTTGAIYFFFKNKEDLFIKLIQKPLNELEILMNEHFEDEKRNAENSFTTSESEDINVAKEIINIMKKNKNIMNIIFKNRENPYVISSMDKMVERGEKQIKEYFSIFNIEIELSVCHWISHIQMERFIYIFEHCLNTEDIDRELELMIKFMRGGFYELISNS